MALKTSVFTRFYAKKRSQTEVFAQKSTSAPKARPRAPKSRREAQKDPQEAAGRPKMTPKRPPEARIRGPPRPTSTRKSYSKILVKRSFETALRKIHESP